MRVLFDNNVPAPLRRHLTGHKVITARQMGWQELENGHLLRAAEDAGFDLLLTGDKNLSYQQNLKGRTISVIVLNTIRWRILRENIEPITAAIGRVKPGSFEQLGSMSRPVRRPDPNPRP